MATYKLNLRNPYTTKTTFNLKVNAGLIKVTLAPDTMKDLTEIHAGFTIDADAPDAVNVGQKISENFMSGYNTLEIIMKDHKRGYDSNVRVRNRPYSDFFRLTV